MKNKNFFPYVYLLKIFNIERMFKYMHEMVHICPFKYTMINKRSSTYVTNVHSTKRILPLLVIERSFTLQT